MNVKNHTQFSKKRLFLGLDKNYFYILMTVAFFMYFTCIILGINMLITMMLISTAYLASLVSFKKDPYWFRKALIYWAIRIKYKSLNDISPR